MCYCILNISSWDDLLITLTSVIVFFNIPGTAGNKVASSASRGLCLGIRAGWLIVFVHWLRRRWSYHPHPRHHHPSHHHTRCSSQTKAALYAQRSVAAMRLMALSHCSCPDCRAPAGAPAGKKSLCCMELDNLSTCNLLTTTTQCARLWACVIARLVLFLAQVRQNTHFFSAY